MDQSSPRIGMAIEQMDLIGMHEITGMILHVEILKVDQLATTALFKEEYFVITVAMFPCEIVLVAVRNGTDEETCFATRLQVV